MTYLNVFFVQQPWPMCQNLVDIVDGTQFWRNILETFQPIRVSTLLQKLFFMQIDQVGALMTCCSLQKKWK